MSDRLNKPCCSKYKYLIVSSMVTNADATQADKVIFEKFKDGGLLNDVTLVKYCPECGNELEMYWCVAGSEVNNG